jgi:hypothetical protein
MPATPGLHMGRIPYAADFSQLNQAAFESIKGGRSPRRDADL